MKNLKQLALNLCLKDTASFTNFFIGGNTQLVTVLSNLYTNDAPCFVYFWGKNSSGKSHLLSALCQLFSEHDLTAAYLPLENAIQFKVNILDDLEELDLFCIDDLHLIAGNLGWEEKIFHSFNKMLAHDKRLVVTANVAPQALPLKLLDLQSRMIGGLVFELYSLNDEEKIVSLKLRAKSKGLDLTDNAANFLLSHYRRDAQSLFEALNRLDAESLKAQRKLTIPFIKEILFQEI
ncbi:MAG: DnaA regulatory inactivator Hda [Coxiellaceae bacterium]|jgi:DnaA family protein|nr:DnaA regulatory inactivator Hda [Coxiellaceae bacterium]